MKPDGKRFVFENNRNKQILLSLSRKDAGTFRRKDAGTFRRKDAGTFRRKDTGTVWLASSSKSEMGDEAAGASAPRSMPHGIETTDWRLVPRGCFAMAPK